MAAPQNDIQAIQTERLTLGVSSTVTGVTAGACVSWMYLRMPATGGTVLLIGASLATGSSITSGYPHLIPTEGWLQFQGPAKFWLHNSAAASSVDIIRGLNVGLTLPL